MYFDEGWLERQIRKAELEIAAWSEAKRHTMLREDLTTCDEVPVDYHLSAELKNEPELLPCPFCGAYPRLVRKSDDEYDIWCDTPDCYLEEGADWYLPREEIIEQWNTRN